MKYHLKKGVVLLEICNTHILFPSRESGIPVPFSVHASDELVSVLIDQASIEEISEETGNKIRRLLKAGYIEEY